MPKKESGTLKKRGLFFLLALMVLAAVGAGVYFWLYRDFKSAEKTSPNAEVPPKKEKPSLIVRKEVPDPPNNNIVNLNKMDQDRKLQEEIRDRKNEYGLDDSVDAILKADESLKIGDSVVPMKEILDKIRIKGGDISEDSIPQKADDSSEELKKKIDARIKEVKKRIKELEMLLSNLPENKDDASYDIYAKELVDLKELVEIYEEYQKVSQEIEKIPEIPSETGTTSQPSTGKDLNELQLLQDKLAFRLEKKLFGDEKPEAFGIHVVKENDNIWNIHFAFLRDYFENKGIRISPIADEPNRLGLSSGFGKILKFSEKIVYIFNLRERKLDVDLDVINPESKIVIFRIDEIFAFLDELDLESVDQIQFDGENIWIPADS